MLESGVARVNLERPAPGAGQTAADGSSPAPSMLTSYGLGALESAAQMATAAAYDAATAAGDALEGVYCQRVDRTCPLLLP